MTRTAIIANGCAAPGGDNPSPEHILTNDWFAYENPDAKRMGVNDKGKPVLGYRVCIDSDKFWNPIFRKKKVGVNLFEDDIFEDEWTVLTSGGIEEVTGMKTRRILAKGETLVDLFLESFEKTNFSANNLSRIIVASVTGDRYPSLASQIQTALKIKKDDFVAIDLEAACAGWVYALDVADALTKRDGGYSAVFGGDALSLVTPYDDRNCVLFGDLAGCAITCLTSQPDIGILATRCRTCIRGNRYIFSDNNEGLRMPFGSRVFKIGVDSMVETTNVVLEKAGVDIRKVKYFFYQQANGRMLNELRGKLQVLYPGVNFDDKIVNTLEHFGNASAGNIAFGVGYYEEKGLLEPGDFFYCGGLGSGIMDAGFLAIR